MQIICCVQCRRIIIFCLMVDADSPQIPYSVINTHVCATVRLHASYDNKCNVVQYLCNRSPELLKRPSLSIDAFYYKKNKNCASIFNTDACKPCTSLMW
jgi:hypothetical protein